VRRALALLALVVLAGCGGTTVVREPTVTVSDGAPAAGAPARSSGGVRIAVVTHGQASSPFWAIVRNGVEAAARQMDVVVSYRAPDVYSVARMETMIDQAVASRPDGLVVSIPEPGVRRALCVNQQAGNQGLDARCRGLARAMRAAGGSARVLGIDDQSAATPRRIADAVRSGRVDGLLALNSTGGMLAVKGVHQLDRPETVKVATFDLGPDVLKAVQRHELLFAVDQQAYLQGYLPIVLLTQRARYGLFPARGDLVPTGPNFVTAREAGKAIELSKRSIR
jgi:simple sugar transport system substrate-binding protein